MPSNPTVSKLPSKGHSPPKSAKGKGKVVPEKHSLVESSSEEDEDEGSDDGVDDQGMTRLMAALGDDALDEYEQAQLRALGGEEDEEWETDEDAEGAAGSESGKDSEVDEEEDEEEDDKEDAGGLDQEGAAAESASDNEEDEIALDNVDDSVDEDAVPRQKIEIDNKVALERIRETIQLDPSLPWTETLTVSYPETIDVDVNDDLNREVAFYKQALHSANAARSLAAKHNFPFTRPSDYFAEMVKSDSHMERIRQRLLDESATIKKGEEKRREREGKKFGKQVQIEKLKEREKSKKEMEERLKSLKRKRKGALDNAQADDDGFDVAVEDAITDRPAKRGKGAGGSKISRTARDKKFGFGGAGRRSKQNTRASTDNFDTGPGKGGRDGFRGGRGGGRGSRGGGGRGGRGGGSKRPGKDKRMAARSRS